MREIEQASREQMRFFLDGSQEVRFEGENREEIYGWVDRIVRGQDYGRLKRADQGLVRRYISKLTGLSGAQIPG